MCVRACVRVYVRACVHASWKVYLTDTKAYRNVDVSWHKGHYCHRVCVHMHVCNVLMYSFIYSVSAGLKGWLILHILTFP